ncbi:translocation/assembly module TamB domain-containing protein [Asticcacaulis tiandongensis]|uniref:translocation/assembly module TamB domain-containing protein n=1 Tax=Asticcacaulis tiandongensis TaxID=2565365 RepID=UPI001129456F|nr:translocation/assembly module TamB domain-containing protein [Asticcacaulis tiandongensis]
MTDNDTLTPVPPASGPEDDLPAPKREPEKKPKKRFPVKKAFMWGGGIVGGLLGLTAIGLVALDTAPGKRFIVNMVASQKPANGLKIAVGRIDGSIYGDMTVRDLKLSDPRGVFFQSKAIRLDWRPFALVGKHVDVRELSSDRVELLRLPELIASEKKESEPFKLPDIRIDAQKVEIKQIYLGQAVTGEAQTLTLNGHAHLKKGRAQIDAALNGDRGDRAVLKLDAAPDDNRLDLSARINAPADGAIVPLLKLEAPLNASLEGKGDWKRWDGKLLGTLGEQSLADLTLTARDGLFGVKGIAHPDRILGPSMQALFAPALAIDLSTTFKDRRADGQVSLASDGLRLAAKGAVDLGKSRFDKLTLRADVLKPATITKGLNGNDVSADFYLDGPFKRPLIDYKIDAKTIGFNDIVVHELHAEGRSRIDGDHVKIPVKARAKHITGLNAAAESLVSNVTIDGDLALDGDMLLSDNLRIRSDKINATAIVIADLGEGIYQGALKGRINQYLIDGIGIVNLVIDADLKTLPGGGFGLVGKVDGQTVRIDNSGLAGFLGGNAKFSGAVNTAANGDIILQRLTLNAPDFRLTSASGRYFQNGNLRFNLTAQSEAYGPLAAEVGGNIKAPTAVLRAERPGLGLQIENLVARLETQTNGYHVTAEGESAYGPLLADVLVRTGQGPLTIDVTQARVAGIDAAGTIVQSNTGPFTGTLTLTGTGINGTANLLAFGEVQGAKISARATNFRTPGETEIVVGRAIIEATARLEDQALITADVQLAEVSYQDMWLSKGRAKIDLKGTDGTIKMVASGDKGAPFDLAANARLSGDVITVAAKGDASGVPFSLEKPARIVKRGDDWVLAPTVLATPRGKVNLAGRFGEELKVQARFDSFDLSLANMVRPDLGISGTATGSVDYTQRGNAFPTGQVRLSFDNLTRATVGSISTPLDMQLEATLNGERTRARGVLRQRGSAIGRFDATIAPGGEGAWVDQLMSGSLSGGLRFNGPASALFSLAGLADQQMSGNVALAADVSGSINAPRLNGQVRGNNLTYENLTFGTRIRQITLEGRFNQDQLDLQRFDGRAGEGTVEASGFISLAAADDFPLRLNAKLNNARIANSEAISSTVSGNLDITNSTQDGPWIRGDLRLPELRYEVVLQSASQVSELEGVRIRGAQPPRQTETRSAPQLWNLDIRIRADNQIFVNGMGLESEWKTDMRVRGTTVTPRVAGNMTVVRGTYAFGGREFDIEKGEITFDGGNLTNPKIEILATAEVDDITGTINIDGLAQNPQITFGSIPSLPQDEVLARILFGESVTNLSATQALQLAASLNSLQGGGGGLNPLGKLRTATGIDRLRVLGADDAAGRGTSLAAGQYLTNNIYIEIVTDAKGFTATQLEIALSRTLSVLTQTGSTSGTAVNLRYSRNY